MVGSKIESAWSGIRPAAGTCGGGKACSDRFACAPRGHYIAHVCGYVLPPGDASLQPCSAASPTPTCVDLPFDYPTSKVITGVLRP
jgi:hypothetical protein